MSKQKIDTVNKQIQSYDAHGLSIDGNYTEFPCLIFGTIIRTDILPLKFELFNNEHLNILEEPSPELILVGTGAHQQFPKPQQVNSERAIEFMDTGLLAGFLIFCWQKTGLFLRPYFLPDDSTCVWQI